MNGPLIYLFGYPGVGKNTIAHEMEKQSDCIAIQNHLLSNAFRHVASRVPSQDYAAIEPSLRHHTMKVWLTFLDFVKESVPQQGLIMTSVLYRNDPARVQFFDFMRRWAGEQNRRFIPVQLSCDEDELLSRLQSPSRLSEFKLTDTAKLQQLVTSYQLLSPDDAIRIDVTELSPEEAARKILEKVII